MNIMEYYLTLKMNEILAHATMQNILEDIMLSKSKTTRQILYDSTYVKHLYDYLD